MLRHVWGGVGWSGSLLLHTCLMLRHCGDVASMWMHGRCYGMSGVGWDDQVHCFCTHAWCHATVMLLARGCMVDYTAKKFLPSNLMTQSGKNKDLLLWMRCWQWRYEHGSDDLLKATGQKLKNLWAQQKNWETSVTRLPRVQFQESHNLAFRERGIYSILTKFYQFSVHSFGHISHFSMSLQKALLYGNHN